MWRSAAPEAGGAARSSPLETENQSFRKRRRGVTRLIEIIRFYCSILFYRAQLYCTPSVSFLKSSSGGGENLRHYDLKLLIIPDVWFGSNVTISARNES